MFYIWLLSISDKIECLFPMGFVFGVISIIVFAFAKACEIENPENPGPAALAKYMKLVLICCFTAGLVGMLTPSRKSLVESYFMVHGSKVVTAENAEKAIDGTVKRIDKLIEKIGQK
jgi:hypothetical protein